MVQRLLDAQGARGANPDYETDSFERALDERWRVERRETLPSGTRILYRAASAAPDPPGSFRWAGLHLAGLSALAIAQPLFDLLSAERRVLRRARLDPLGHRRSSPWASSLLPPAPPARRSKRSRGSCTPQAATVLHLAFLAALVGLLALQALRGLGSARPRSQRRSAAAAALRLRAGAAGPYAPLGRRAPRRSSSLVLFLFFSPVSAPASRARREPRLAGGALRSAPVVMVVLDELPTVSLIRADGEIDAVRYPNFARLAGGRDLVPRTRRRCTSGRLARCRRCSPAVRPRRTSRSSSTTRTTSSRSWAARYDLNVHESQTHLCPPELCDPEREPLAGAGRVAALRPLGRLRAPRALPEDLADELPSHLDGVARLRRGRRPAGAPPGGPGAARRGGPPAYTERDAEVRDVRRLARHARRGPRSRSCTSSSPTTRGSTCRTGRSTRPTSASNPGSWTRAGSAIPSSAIQAHQRHLLQVGYTDLALGRILDRLEADRPLRRLARRGGRRPRRQLPPERRTAARRAREHGGDRLRPALREGARADSRARRWTAPGADDRHRADDRRRARRPGSLGARRSLTARRAGARRRGGLVGTSSGDVVEGDLDDLVGRAATRSSRGRSSSSARATIGPDSSGSGPGPSSWDAVSTGSPWRRRGGPTFSKATAPATTTPTRRSRPSASTGGSTARPPGQDMAIAVNGRIVAVTRSFEHDGDTLVTAVTPRGRVSARARTACGSTSSRAPGRAPSSRSCPPHS